jgi:hypothetical protein
MHSRVIRYGRVYKPRCGFLCHQGGLAQLAERVLSMHEVQGSIP